MSSNNKQNQYKLAYFNVRALAEPIRWIFQYAGVEFEDKRIPWDYKIWFAETKKEFASTVGQIPVLYVNGKELSQSGAISKYLATEFKLIGETSWERAREDEIIALVFDLFHFWRRQFFERNPESRKILREMIDHRFKIYYSKFNELLKENPGNYLHGHKLSYADFWLASFIDIWDNPLDGDDVIRPIVLDGLEQIKWDTSTLYPDLTFEYPELRKHKERILEIPQIKSWIQKRPKTLI